ncbi:MAG: radical SAM protein [Candidatus Methanoplasma sp.]|jgi:uncharacterized protein|nr:radical SAM protein [Candidatus Methanoplasma sp.]
MKRSISVVIKPTLACNLSCRHCYHAGDDRSGAPVGMDRLDRLFGLLSEEYESVWFIWHGGEPLLLPLRFYRDAIRLQEKWFGRDSHRVGNTIQTNGLLLDKRIADFCREKEINIGVSSEGPLSRALRGEEGGAEEGIALLRKRSNRFSVGAAVSSETASGQPAIYRHFMEMGVAVSLSPVTPCGGGCPGPSLAPDPGEYIRSSIEAFDEWLWDPSAEAPLIPHYLYALSALGEPAESDCAHSSCLTRWICMYPNGDLYPCAKGGIPEFRLCNLDDIARVSDAFSTEAFRRILLGTVARREKCRPCPLYESCGGGCSVDAHREGRLEDCGGASCRIFREVFSHVKGEIDGIAGGGSDLSECNRFVRDAVIGRLVGPGGERPA